MYKHLLTQSSGKDPKIRTGLRRSPAANLLLPAGAQQKEKTGCKAVDHPSGRGAWLSQRRGLGLVAALVAEAGPAFSPRAAHCQACRGEPSSTGIRIRTKRPHLGQQMEQRFSECGPCTRVFSSTGNLLIIRMSRPTESKAQVGRRGTEGSVLERALWEVLAPRRSQGQWLLI